MLNLHHNSSVRISLRIFIFLTVLTTFLWPASDARAGEQYLKFIAGIGDLDDGGGIEVDDPRFATSATTGYDLGFRSGLAYGWKLSDRFALEGEYLYSTNDLDTVVFSDGQSFDEGNYASVVISANAYTFFRPGADFQPYVGAGLGWLQEVDIDFETEGEEISFSTDDFGFQLMTGLLWKLGDHWAIDLQARWFSASDIEMEAENGSGLVRADYEPWSLLLGVNYRF